jgi:hypothetical protein
MQLLQLAQYIILNYDQSYSGDNASDLCSRGTRFDPRPPEVFSGFFSPSCRMLGYNLEIRHRRIILYSLYFTIY